MSQFSIYVDIDCGNNLASFGDDWFNGVTAKTCKILHHCHLVCFSDAASRWGSCAPPVYPVAAADSLEGDGYYGGTDSGTRGHQVWQVEGHQEVGAPRFAKG